MEMLHKLLMRLQASLEDQQIIESVEGVATKGAYAASGVTIYSGLTVNEWGVVVGMVLGAATFGFNVWFKMKYGRGKK
jgi:hypothetical protein